MVADPMRGPLTFTPGSPASGCAALARFTYVCFFGMEPRGRDAPGSMFSSVMVAPRPRTVRGLNASWPRGSKYSPRREKAANKEKARKRAGKGPGMFANVQAPQPPGKIQNEFIRLVGKAKAPPHDLASVLAALFAGGKSGRRYRARCPRVGVSPG